MAVFVTFLATAATPRNAPYIQRKSHITAPVMTIFHINLVKGPLKFDRFFFKYYHDRREIEFSLDAPATHTQSWLTLTSLLTKQLSRWGEGKVRGGLVYMEMDYLPIHPTPLLFKTYQIGGWGGWNYRARLYHDFFGNGRESLIEIFC